MNDPPDPFTSVSSAWLLGSASNCGSVWFTVRKRWKRSANNRLGKLEISSSGGEEWRGGGDPFLIRGREIGSRNLERIPSTRFIYANSYVWLFPADDWPASNPILAPRHELRLLSTVSCGIAVWMESRRNQLLTEKKKKRIDNRLSTRSDTQRGFLARVIYEPRCRIDSRRILAYRIRTRGDTSLLKHDNSTFLITTRDIIWNWKFSSDPRFVSSLLDDRNSEITRNGRKFNVENKTVEN